MLLKKAFLIRLVECRHFWPIYFNILDVAQSGKPIPDLQISTTKGKLPTQMNSARFKTAVHDELAGISEVF